MQSVVRLAFARYYRAIGSAQLFEDRNLERLPEQFPVIVSQSIAIEIGQNYQAAQIREVGHAAQPLIRQGKRGFKRSYDRIGRPLVQSG